MKILQINKFYYRRRGAETYFFDLIHLLEQHGHEVAVFSMEHPENLPSPYSKYFLSNIEYGNLASVSWRNKLRSVHRVLWSREAQRNLEQLLKDFKPDIAHIHNIYHQISPSVLATLKKHRIPIVQSLHDYKLLSANYKLLVNDKIYEASKGGKYYNELRYKSVKDSFSASALGMVEMYLHKYLKIYEKSVDCFISPSDFLRSKIKEWRIPVKRVEVIRNFVHTNAITPTYSNKGYLLYAGALSEEKGVELLLDSLKNFKYDFALHIAGSGPRASVLQHRARDNGISNNVTWLGQLSPQELAVELAGALAVVVPSRWYENCPYSILEAFAHGKPVIGTNIGGIPELVQPQRTGWLFPLNSASGLRDQLNELHVRPQLASQYGKEARAWVEANASPEIHYKKIHALYSEYISHSDT